MQRIIQLIRLGVGTVLVVAVTAAIFFSLGWWIGDRNAFEGPLLELAGKEGFTTLISPGVVTDTGVYEPTGRVVPFLGNSDMNVLDPSSRYLFTSHETSERAGVTRIDLIGDQVDVILRSEEFVRLDGLFWTPWNTLLVAEERIDGKLFEILNPLASPDRINFVFRPAFGTRVHEGLSMDWRGFLYGVDETEEGAIYRYRPDSPLGPDALESGQLEVLVVLGEFEELDEFGQSRRPAVWRPARTAAGTPFNRPEDLEVVDKTLYVIISGENSVISIDLRDIDDPTVGIFISEDVYDHPIRSPDNIASDARGNFYISEDHTAVELLDDLNHVWYVTVGEDVLSRAASVTLFATIKSRTDEPSGLLVDVQNNRLFMSILGPNNSIFVIPLD